MICCAAMTLVIATHQRATEVSGLAFTLTGFDGKKNTIILFLDITVTTEFGFTRSMVAEREDLFLACLLQELV